MNAPESRRARIRRLFGYTLVAQPDFDELVHQHEGLIDAALVMHSALERISTIRPAASARPAILISRGAIRAAERTVRPRR